MHCSKSLSGAISLLVILSPCGGCVGHRPIVQELSPGTVIRQEGMNDLHDELAERINSAPPESMKEPGLVGALGGIRVKLLQTGPQQVLLPLPQAMDGQVPLTFCVRSSPLEAVDEYRLQRRDRSNDVLSVLLKGTPDQEVRIEWSSLVLVAGESTTPDPAKPDSYRRSSGCVQAESAKIQKLAVDLWPENGQVAEYAARIQQWIREMKPVQTPQSLDALGILDSGANGICTANANLALALLRAKGVPSRSMAVIPPISQRLEMHRIVEYFDEDQWLPFDPSALHTDLPMKPYQSIIMAKTTIADEELAMQPRMGSMRGCPYGQELELRSGGATLWGQDFFWTLAKPVARFQPEDDAFALAKNDWDRFLREGTLSAGQLAAASATNSAELLKALTPK